MSSDLDDQPPRLDTQFNVIRQMILELIAELEAEGLL